MLKVFVFVVFALGISSANAQFSRAAEGDIDFIGSTDYCSPDSAGHYPIEAPIVQDQTVTSGVSDQGGACVPRSIEQTLAALANPDNLAWPHTQPDGDAVEVATNDLPAGASSATVMSYKQKANFIYTAHWKMEFAYSVTEGTKAEPKQIRIRYKKVSGESHIAVWSGVIELNALTHSMTSIAVRDVMDATQISNQNTREGVSFLIDRARNGSATP
jgi:hypothetical protein